MLFIWKQEGSTLEFRYVVYTLIIQAFRSYWPKLKKPCPVPWCWALEPCFQWTTLQILKRTGTIRSGKRVVCLCFRFLGGDRRPAFPGWCKALVLGELLLCPLVIVLSSEEQAYVTASQRVWELSRCLCHGFLAVYTPHPPAPTSRSCRERWVLYSLVFLIVQSAAFLVKADLKKCFPLELCSLQKCFVSMF